MERKTCTKQFFTKWWSFCLGSVSNATLYTLVHVTDLCVCVSVCVCVCVVCRSL